MNPLSLKASNYRTFESLELDLPSGCLAVIGENGAGKSSIVNVIDLCLFGPESRSLADYLTDDGASTELEIELTFEHAGELYRVRRGFSARGRGKTTLDFEREEGWHVEPDGDGEPMQVQDPPGTFAPLTRESQKETQAAIEEVLGLSRETFRASAFLAQGDGAAFTEAQPRERKRILAEVLGLSVWEELSELNRATKRGAERERDELAGRIAFLEEKDSHVPTLEQDLADARDVVATADHDHANAEQALTAAAEKVAGLERAESSFRARKSEVETAKARLEGKHAIVDRAAAAKLEAVEAQKQIADLPTNLDVQKAILEEAETRDVVSNTEGRIREHAARREARDAAVTRRADLLGRASALNETAHALREQADHALAHVGEARCDVCQQILGAEAAEATAKRLREQADIHDFTASELDVEAKAIEIPELGEEPKRDPMADTRWAAAQAKLERARNDLAQRLRLEERLDGLQRTIAEVTPELTAEVARLAAELVAAREALDEVDEPEPGALDSARLDALAAKGRLDEAAGKLTESRAALVRAESALEQAQKIAEELDSARAGQERLLGELDLLALLERAYGRDGIPALIVESSAIPAIETEANRILAELGTSYRVELRTQRALKSGDGLSDTLDVVVIADAGERAYETFSGGERTRINLALRIALARLLAHRRGAESRMLAIDEPEFLDEAGTTKLAEVLRGLEPEFERILLVSHVPTLRDAFDQSIEVVKDGSRSAVIA